MATEQSETPQNPKTTPKLIESKSNGEPIFSPRFRSVAAMAGWDEEALLLASLIVEDTPERESKQRKRPDFPIKTPPPSSRRKRRAKRANPSPIPSVVLDLDEEEGTNSGQAANGVKESESKSDPVEEKKRGGGEETCTISTDTEATASFLLLLLLLFQPCLICLEICYEPSTTPCGHSFCKKCLKSAADKCGKRCPKCRQLIGNGRSCTVNTVLWNTIQLLFPQEIEARKASARDTKSREAERESSRDHSYNVRSRSIRPVMVSSRDVNMRRRRNLPSQDEDAAYAMRLQREEFMDVFRGTPQEQVGISSVSLARANLRAMASRANSLRIRNRHL
ncbi:hypothetical protein Scep_021078 [Stephania cephalantha]|uniref:RING-type E3 ubiquitin transferase n=1 Tax=Stephania cephalantha TaxID=152367 RepID=A0AAP0I1L0_9MAGN